jgi:bifunctional DNA-binding transcriptional regulator/antitoxin component of YhaV-PrlF toxin-antitoxin module
VRVDAKGRVRIPVALREAAGLLPGTPVHVQFDGSAVTVMRADTPAPGRGAWIVAHLRGRGDIGMTTDEIMELTRG